MRLGGARAAVEHLARVGRTARHVTARQLVARLWLAGRFYAYRRVPPLASLGLHGSAGLAPGAQDRLAGWVARKFPAPLSEPELARADAGAAGRFTFLGRTRDFGGGPVDWRAAGMSRLWQYHLHYAADVALLARAAAQTGSARWATRAWGLIEDWIEGNPPGGRPGWEPFPLSVRVVSWATAFGALATAAGSEERLQRLAPAIAAHGRFLERHLEYHLGGNHLVKNAKALVVLGALLAGPEAVRWGRAGRALLTAELRRQVLADGGHCERSPLYHAGVLEDVLDCLALAPLPDPEREELTGIARRMAGWLATMCHPDGELPLFNDCVRAGEPSPRELLAYAARLVTDLAVPANGAVALPESGYYVLASGPGRMIIDCGAVGPDALPAHAHADTLSYELTWHGERLVVDSGTAEYALDEVRRYVRSTRAHNTVMVDEVEQSEVWASHRVGRRARPVGARLTPTSQAVVFTGAHDGYRGLGVAHHRHVFALADAWLVVDELLGAGPHRFASFIHLDPGVGVEPSGSGWRLATRRDQVRVEPLGPVTIRRATGTYCPSWGRVIPNTVLELRGDARLPVAFGYVLTPAESEWRFELEADRAGVTLTGRGGTRRLELRSRRCTS